MPKISVPKPIKKKVFLSDPTPSNLNVEIPGQEFGCKSRCLKVLDLPEPL